MNKGVISGSGWLWARVRGGKTGLWEFSFFFEVYMVLRWYSRRRYRFRRVLLVFGKEIQEARQLMWAVRGVFRAEVERVSLSNPGKFGG